MDKTAEVGDLVPEVAMKRHQHGQVERVVRAAQVLAHLLPQEHVQRHIVISVHETVRRLRDASDQLRHEEDEKDGGDDEGGRCLPAYTSQFLLLRADDRDAVGRGRRFEEAVVHQPGDNEGMYRD